MSKTLGIAVSVVALATGAWTMVAGRMTLTADSKVWVAGTSSVRSYTCKAVEVDGSVMTSAPIVKLEDAGSVVEAVTLTVEVDKMDCANGTMNAHMKKALKVQDHPTIEFQAKSVQTAADPDGSVLLTLVGDLKMAGQTQPLAVEGTMVRGEDGALRYRGQVGFDMTKWGVKPPSLMFGTMKVHAPVVVGFDVALTESG